MWRLPWWLRWRGERPEVTRARAAAARAQRHLDRVRADDPAVRARTAPIRRIERENNLAPIIIRALGIRE